MIVRTSDCQTLGPIGGSGSNPKTQKTAVPRPCFPACCTPRQPGGEKLESHHDSECTPWVLKVGWTLRGRNFIDHNRFNKPGRSGSKVLLPRRRHSRATQGNQRADPHIKDLTPETHIYPPDCDLITELRALDWPEYFIKDYVKSLKTSVGSRISNPQQVSALVEDMQRFRA